MSSAPAAADVLVVGAGRAAQQKLRVAVVDDNPSRGGQIWRGEEQKPSSQAAQVWLQRIQSANIRFIGGARIFQQAKTGQLLAETKTGVVDLSYNKLILATGARERFLPFPGWTLPNVAGAGGLQALVKTGLTISGKRVVIAGSGPLLLAVANYLREHGANVLLIAEQASRSRLARFALSLLNQHGKRRDAIELKRRLKGVKYLSGCS